MLLIALPIRAIAEVEQNLVVGRVVDLLAAHFKVRPVSAAFTGTGYSLYLKSLDLAPSARLGRRKPATPKLDPG